MSPRIWRAVGVAAGLLLVVASWFGLISPTLQDAGAVQEETLSQTQAANQLRSRISLLKKQSAEMPAQEAILAGIQQRMPSDASLPGLIRDLTEVAQTANVSVSSVTPGRPTHIKQAEAAPAKKAKPAAEDAKAGDAKTDAEAAPAKSTKSKTAQAAPTGPQVQAISLNITACGTFAQLRSYLRELEQMKRLVSVSGLTITRGACADGADGSAGGASEDDLTATVQAAVFSLPKVATATDVKGASR